MFTHETFVCLTTLLCVGRPYHTDNAIRWLVLLLDTNHEIYQTIENVRKTFRISNVDFLRINSYNKFSYALF